jgi:predicted acyl esterase
LLRFALLPISWLFRAGHRLRLALAAADRDHFSRIPDGRPPRLRIFRGGAQGSRLRLPLIRRA